MFFMVFSIFRKNCSYCYHLTIIKFHHEKSDKNFVPLHHFPRVTGNAEVRPASVRKSRTQCVQGCPPRRAAFSCAPFSVKHKRQYAKLKNKIIH